MNNNLPIKEKKESSSYLFPILGALALIIGCALYIVYKLAERDAAEKWADYDECGWS
ncbi:MAG: hypothetical protein IJX15_00190 [Ruminiclostridium sp.]|nr:hypothetical protein [Ruminiclostridium sp.]MBQ8410138.1 hypothetical protein [Ruminiclostridium sp.]MBQ8842868.1 hypothetical protein [Ruminiclostridium sp.]